MPTKPFDGKSRTELEAMVAEDRARLHDLRIKLSVGQLRDVREVREIRNRIARMLTQVATIHE